MIIPTNSSIANDLLLIYRVNGLLTAIGEQHASAPSEAVLRLPDLGAGLEEDLVTTVGGIRLDRIQRRGVDASAGALSVADEPLQVAEALADHRLHSGKLHTQS